MQPTEQYRKYLFPIVVAFAALQIAIALNLIVLWRTGELQTIESLSQQQSRTNFLYGALSIRLADYKYSRYREIAPEIVAIGTSRAMQFRQQMFNAKFYNLGGLVQGADQANLLADQLLLKFQRPKFLLFALDFWTFCELRSTRIDSQPLVALSHDGMEAPDKLFIVYQLLFERRFSMQQIMSAAIHANLAERVGIGATIGRTGFVNDGSIRGEPDESSDAVRFAGTRDRIRLGAAQFVKGCRVSETSIRALRLFRSKLETTGIQVVFFLAPVAPAIATEMNANSAYAYIADLSQRLKLEFPSQFFDFFDVASMSTDAEFLDGFHGGEATYMRILHAISQKSRTTAQFVDEKALSSRLRQPTR